MKKLFRTLSKAAKEVREAVVEEFEENMDKLDELREDVAEKVIETRTEYKNKIDKAEKAFNEYIKQKNSDGADQEKSESS